MPRRATSIALIAAYAALATGCGGGDTGGTTQDQAPRPPAARERVEPATCPAQAGAGCRSATGRIAFVQAVDPDGDGDAHFVIVDPQGISLPGLTSIDVSAELRPQPLPGPGDLVSAAGPVQTGSYGQAQIHAIEINVAGQRG